MDWYLKALKQYADFNGRSRRKEYWMFMLFNLIFLIPISIVDGVIGSFPILYAIYLLAMFIPTLAVSVRRLHDIGKSGWMYLIVLIPLVGGIWLLVLMVTDSSLEENQYGMNPKEI